MGQPDRDRSIDCERFRIYSHPVASGGGQSRRRFDAFRDDVEGYVPVEAASDLTADPIDLILTLYFLRFVTGIGPLGPY